MDPMVHTTRVITQAIILGLTRVFTIQVTRIQGPIRGGIITMNIMSTMKITIATNSAA